MNEKSRKLVGIGLLIIAVIVFLQGGNESTIPPAKPGLKIYKHTVKVLQTEFGLDHPADEVEILKNPTLSSQILDDLWILMGTQIVDGKKQPWRAQIKHVPDAPTATLLELELNGELIFPTSTKSNMVFETRKSTDG